MKNCQVVELPWQLYIVPGSHFDLGWCQDPEGCLTIGDFIIKQAFDLMLGDQPNFRFTIEYVEFFRHFIESFPQYRKSAQWLLAQEALEVCATSVGAMEQILDGELLVRELTQGIRWLETEMGYVPRCAQHTDLPGHTIQMPQILRKCGIRFISYSRYRPPVPLHRWRAPDGSTVIACNHVYHYNWGNMFRVALEEAEKHLLPDLEGPVRELWPVKPVLVPDEHDLEWVDPEMGARIKAWNQAHSDVAHARFATLAQFFAAVEEATEKEPLPAYQGEFPYGFYSIPAFEPQTYQEGRIAENLLAAAEKFSVVRELLDLGGYPCERLTEAWRNLFYPHDHNIAGEHGDTNDAIRMHKARHARFEAEAVLQEIEAACLLHLEDDRDLGKAVLVFNGLSWPRSGVVETLMELPGPAVNEIVVKDPAGRPVPCQLLNKDRADEDRIDYRLDNPELAKWQVRVAFLAENVPATGHRAFYVSKGSPPQPEGALEISENHLANDFWQIRLGKGRVSSIVHVPTGRELVAKSRYKFHQLVALEDLRGNLEDGYDPWDLPNAAPNFTGREWKAKVYPKKIEIVEPGPLRAVLRIPGRLEESLVVQELRLYAGLPHIDWITEIDWQGKKHRQVRLQFPFALRKPKVRYETPFGSVVFGRDEMPGTYRGDGTRWVQKWIDVSEKDFGVTLSAGCCAVNFHRSRVAPVLLATTYCRGDAFYWITNPGIHRFKFSFVAHDGNFLKDRSYGIGWEDWQPLRVARMNPRLLGVEHLRILPEEAEYLRCDHPAAVATALKKSDDGEGYVLRLYNVSGETIATEATLGFDATEVEKAMLTEKGTGPVGFGGRNLPVELGPHEIRTYRFRIRS